MLLRSLWSRAVAVFACAAVCLGPGTRAARILAVQTNGDPVHWEFMSGVLRALVDGGHAVTAFTPFPHDGGRRVNYTEVDVSKGLWLPTDVAAAAATASLRTGTTTGRWTDLWSGDAEPTVAASREQCDRVYGNHVMRGLLRRRDAAGFDAVVVEPLASGCASHAANALRVPLIHVTASPAAERCRDRGRVPATFVRRLTDAVRCAATAVRDEFAELRLRRSEPRAYDRLEPVAPSLVFANGHFATPGGGPTAANVVNVAGIHFKTAKRLPKDVLEFIEQSPNGVVYFSFGSTVKISTIPEYIKKTFMEALAQVPQRVLLKYEDNLRCKPKNVMIKKNLPQRDILLHPKVKLFISHGGISGLYEAVDAGIPVLGFPLFADQWRNMENLENVGMAISMDILSVSNDTFLKNILDLVNDENYSKNAKAASKLFKDRPMRLAQSVVYWTEYVLRHKGAPHLRSHALNLAWYQYYLLDVTLTILIFIFLVFFLTYKCLKSINNYYLYYTTQDLKAKSE